MVNFRLKYSLFVIWMLLYYSGISQGHLFSEVSINKSSVYKAEPVEVRVSIFTSTWFTKGVDPGNIKVDGAFTIYFRSVSETRNVNGKTYAGVTMIFNVFPYENDDILFPAVTFKVETPDEGAYKGVSRSITTQPKAIKVKPVPEGFDVSQWLVTQNVSVKQNFSGNLSSIKVGDVIERTLTRSVSGNVSGLIPAIVWDTINGISTYIGRSDAKDNKTRTSISAERTDKISYLFEGEGEVVIPATEITWWNPVQNKAYKRTLKEIIIEVQPNPEIGMLESIRDSLMVQNQVAMDQVEKNKLEIFGLSVKEFVTVLIIVAALSYFLIVGTKRIVLFYRKRRQQYFQSELYFFRLFLKASRQNRTDKTLRALYRWIDALKLHEPTLAYFAKISGEGDLLIEVKMIENNSSADQSLNTKIWKKARTNFLQRKNINQNSSSKLWIN